MKVRLLAIAFACVVAAVPARAADAYVAMTIVDPDTERRVPDGYIVVDGGKISAIGSGALPREYAGARRHDMRGLFATPGFIDTHAHVTLGPIAAGKDAEGPYVKVAYDPAVIAANARTLLAFGVTTIRNPAGDVAQNVAYARAVREGRIVGPEALSAGPVIDRLFIRFIGLADQPTPEHPVRDIVNAQIDAGADYIKLYTGLTEADLAEGIAAAHARGVKTIAHLEAVSWTKAANLGLDAIVHMMPVSPELLSAERRAAYTKTYRPGGFTFFQWYEAADLDGPEIAEMIRVLAQRRVHLDATLIAFKLAFWGDDPSMIEPDLAYAHSALVANWRAGFRFDAGWTADDYRRAKAVWPKVLTLTRRLYEAGVPMTIGTDTPNPFVAPGISMAREMQLHVDAGIPPWAVLRMATGGAADILGIGNRTGHLKPGMEADVAFVSADPSINAGNAAKVEQVLNNGVLYRAAELRSSH